MDLDPTAPKQVSLHKSSVTSDSYDTLRYFQSSTAPVGSCLSLNLPSTSSNLRKRPDVHHPLGLVEQHSPGTNRTRDTGHSSPSERIFQLLWPPSQLTLARIGGHLVTTALAAFSDAVSRVRMPIDQQLSEPAFSGWERLSSHAPGGSCKGGISIHRRRIGSPL